MQSDAVMTSSSH